MNFGPLIIGNPAGLWALLGVPVLVMIHFLQRKVTKVPVSTGFLLDHIAFQSPEGSRFERFRSSLPFWLQLLVLLLLASLLADLDWRSVRPLRRVAVVVDGSASMVVSRDRARDALVDVLSAGDANTRYDITMTASDRGRDVLFRGDSLTGAAQALDGWMPTAGSHDPSDALRTARALVGDHGVVLFLSDQAPEDPLPYAAHFIAAGESASNVGITSVRVVKSSSGDHRINAMIYHFGEGDVTCEWTVGFPEIGQSSTPRTVTLGGRAAAKIEAGIPPSATRAVLSVVSGDGFSLDNVAPVVVPLPKRLTVGAVEALDPDALSYWQRIVNALDEVEWSAAEDATDVMIATRRSPKDVHSILHLPTTTDQMPLRTDAIASAVHPLVSGLNWQAIAPRDRDGFSPNGSVIPLLWQGDASLAWVERSGKFRHLVMNMHPAAASGISDPSLVVMCARFLQKVREAQARPETLMTETGTPLTIVLPERSGDHPPDAKPPLYQWAVTPIGGGEQSVWLEAGELRGLDTPMVPSWFGLSDEGGRNVVDGAVYFSDTREMDFTRASSMTDVPVDLFDGAPESQGVVSRDVSVVLLAVIGVLLVTWYVMRGKDDANDPLSGILSARGASSRHRSGNSMEGNQS